MTRTAVIETIDLSLSFGETMAVSGLNLVVEAGEVFGFLGHNGAGKTTTIRLLNGVLAADRGSARVLGFAPVADGPALRRRTGVLTETPSLDERLTGRDNLTIFADLYGVPQARVNGRVAELLSLFELSNRAEEKVSGYSKGMKQRLALARALLHEPELLFLDEPTTGLDPVAARQVHDLIRHLSREEARTVFLCTHNLAEAQTLCDRVGVMEQGRLLALGTPAELAAQLHQALNLEIEVAREQVDQAVALLARRPGLRPATGDNGLITVAGVRREDIPELAAGLVAAGVRLYRLDLPEPSLTDVYFSLHEARVAAEGGQPG